MKLFRDILMLKLYCALSVFYMVILSFGHWRSLLAMVPGQTLPWPLRRQTCQAQPPHVVRCLESISVVCSPYAFVVLVHLVQLVWTNVSFVAFT